ncbi:MAG: nucleoside-triphosphatase [bacterium]
MILFVGPVGGGKTTVLAHLVSEWRQSGKDVRGLLAHRVMEDGCPIGYDMEVIGEKKRSVLARKEGIGIERTGPFVFFDEALARGRRALRDAAKADIVVVDEVGPLELRGGGWASEVERLLSESEAVVIFVVREDLQLQIIEWLKPLGRTLHSFHFREAAKLTSLL